MRSSAGRSKAGSRAGAPGTSGGRAPREAGSRRPPAAPPAGAATPLAGPSGRRAGVEPGTARLLGAFDRGEFPPTLYCEGPSEPLKASLLAELRAAWARSLAEPEQLGPGAHARVLRAAEAGVEEILAAYHGGSLFSPRELTIVLEIEDLGRSEKKIAALAEGLGRPAGGSCLVLVESAAESPRKSLEPLRAAAAARWVAWPPARHELIAWGARRLEHANLACEPGVLEALADASEGDPLAYFSELGKLERLATGNAVGRAELALLLRPAVGAELPDYLAQVALGDPGRAARSLGRLLAAGVSEGTILFALANLVGGALGGWARNRELSDALRRRSSPRELTVAMDALYRAESAWKGGRADAVAVLEQATRVVAGS